MQELVKMLAPLSAMEREAGHVEHSIEREAGEVAHSIERVQHTFGRRHHDETEGPETGRPLP